MILHPVFLYTAQVLAPRQRNPRERIFTGRTSVEVEEVSLSDLPVAFRWARGDEPHAPSGDHEVRWDGESLWERLHSVERSGQFGGGSVVSLRDGTWLEHQADYRNIGLQRYGDNLDPLQVGFTRTVETYPFADEDPTVRRVLSSDHDARVGHIRSAASRLLVADGLLFARAREPVYEIRRREEHPARITQPRSYAGGVPYWRVDEVELMVEAHALGSVPDVDRVEVLIPEAVQAPLPERALHEAGSRCVAFLDRHSDRVDPDRFAVRDRLAHAVVETYQALLQDRPVDAAALVSALEEAKPDLDAIRRLVGDELSSERQVDDALRRLDARSLASDFGLPSP